MQFMPKWVVGVWGDATWHDQEWSVSLPFLPAPNTLASMEVESEWGAGLRAGYLVTDDALVYVLAGYSRLMLGDLSVPAVPVSFSAPDLDGFKVGGGMELNLDGNWYLQGQYSYARYSGGDVSLIPSVLSLNVEPEVHTGRVGLLYRFNLGPRDETVFTRPLK